MQPKFVLIGLNLMVLALVTGIFGWNLGEYSLIGIASSIALFSIVCLVLGLTHREPSIEFLKTYSELMRSAIMKVIEDTQLLNHVIHVIPKGGGGSYLVITKDVSHVLTPKDITPLVGISDDGSTYVSMEIPKLIVESGIPLDSLEPLLNTLIVSDYGIASSVKVITEGNRLRVLIMSINPHLTDLLKKPLSPISLLAVTTISQALNKHVVLLREEATFNDLELQVLVVS